MDANEIELLAEAIVRQQALAAEKAAADAEETTRVTAEADAVQAAEDRKAAEKEAAEQAEADRVATETKARVAAVLTAKTGDVFTDAAGAKHRVVGTTFDGIDTVSRDVDGGTVGNWRQWRPEGHPVIANWKKA